MANFVLSLLLLLLFIVCEPRAKTTIFEEQNWVETWLIRPSPGFRGIKILKFITDPYDLASLLFILAILVDMKPLKRKGCALPKSPLSFTI